MIFQLSEILCVLDPAFENTISLYVLILISKFGFSCLKSILLFLNGSINCELPTGESYRLVASKRTG